MKLQFAAIRIRRRSFKWCQLALWRDDCVLKGWNVVNSKRKEMSILLTISKVPGYILGVPIAASFVWPGNLARKGLNLIIIKTIIWYFNFVLNTLIKFWTFLWKILFLSSLFSSVQSLSYVWFFATPWTAAHLASLSITKSQRLLKFMSIESVMPSNHLILCRPLLFLPSIFPSIWIFPNESVLCIRWPKYWSFSFSISDSNEYSGLISFRIDWLDLLAVQETQESSNTIVQKHHLFDTQLSLSSVSSLYLDMVYLYHHYILIWLISILLKVWECI